MVTVKDLEDLATKLNISAYDLLLVGDGSGTTIGKCGGGTCILYDRKAQAEPKLEVYHCAFNHATNNFVELIPYVHALWAYELKTQRMYRFWNYNYKVEIVSDSELIVKQGNGEYARNANSMLWNSMNWLSENGYELHWNWVPRNSNPVNTLCDNESRKMRQLMENALA